MTELTVDWYIGLVAWLILVAVDIYIFYDIFRILGTKEYRWAYWNKCTECEAFGSEYWQHDTLPCPECGEKIIRTVGRKNPKTKQWEWKTDEP